MKDYELVSIQTDDAYHRRGFEVRYRYPGEGVADRCGRWCGRSTLGSPDREYHLAIEGLDNTAEVRRPARRLAPALALLRATDRGGAPGMRCVVFTGAGGHEVIAIEERPDPEPGTEDVLVASTLRRPQPGRRRSSAPAATPRRPAAPPDIPGLEVSGTVEALRRRA